MNVEHMNSTSINMYSLQISFNIIIIVSDKFS